LGKIEDVPEARNRFIAVYDEKTKAAAVRFGLLYGKRLLGVAGIAPCAEVLKAFDAMRRWLEGKTNYHEARNIAFGDLCRRARAENDPVRERFYRTMAQIACIPHVKYHALWAADFAVTLINRMYPGDLEEALKERDAHTALLAEGHPAKTPRDFAEKAARPSRGAISRAANPQKSRGVFAEKAERRSVASFAVRRKRKA
jgi:hypothetical protein